MTKTQSATRERLVEGVGVLGVVGVALALLTLRRSRSRERWREREDRHASFVTYLREHLAGADAAIQVVERLKYTHETTAEGPLFASLYEQLLEDRAVVTALLTDLGASSRSIKRLASHATATLLKGAAGGTRGELNFFRTLEALAIGVQGKRCLWRAAQVLAPPLRAPGPRNFVELEARAVDQWETIERCRRCLAPLTFDTL
jgi:hypothetical protein